MYTVVVSPLKDRIIKTPLHSGETVPHYECLPSCIHRDVYKPASEIRAHLVLEYNRASALLCPLHGEQGKPAQDLLSGSGVHGVGVLKLAFL